MNPSGVLGSLTPRELEIAYLIGGEALSTKAIAKRVGLSEHTVKYHLASIRKKLHARTTLHVAIIIARAASSPGPGTPAT